MQSKNDTPEQASRPWSVGRDGFVIAEGAGILVLEEYEHAKKRGAKIYAELVGFGSSGDAYNIVLPEPEGKGQIKAMERAIADAKITPEQIGYVNAHGTSTPKGDIFEFNSVKSVFANCLNTLSIITLVSFSF